MINITTGSVILADTLMPMSPYVGVDTCESLIVVYDAQTGKFTDASMDQLQVLAKTFTARRPHIKWDMLLSTWIEQINSSR